MLPKFNASCRHARRTSPGAREQSGDKRLGERENNATAADVAGRKANSSPVASPCMSQSQQASRQAVDYGTDQLLADIADYVVAYDLQSPDAVKNARYSLLDALGCALLALNVPEARTLLGPVVPGAHGGAHSVHVPGTSFALDPVCAAFSTGALVSWLDYNDCWLGAEW